MAAPLPEGDMNRSEILHKEKCEVVLRYLAQTQAHRQMRAENLIEFNYGDAPLAEKLLFENENFMELWHTALAYSDQPKDMADFMSNDHLLDHLVPLMVQGGNYWWTPCGFCLWKCLTPESPLVIPCYYMQKAVVWGPCYPCTVCSGSCYRALIGPLAPQTKIIDDRKVAALEKTINSSVAECTNELKENPTWEFSFAKADGHYLQSEEVIAAARFSLAAYMPTTKESARVYYCNFVPLIRERFIEKRFRETGTQDAVDSLNSFVDFFYTPASPDPNSKSKSTYGYGRPIKEIIEGMNFELVCGFDISKSDTQGFIAKSRNFETNGGDIIISFRGTTSISDWLTNLNGRKVPFDPEKSGKAIGMVHAGFYGAFMSIIDLIKKHAIPLIDLNKPTRVFVTGHSLGGAVATLTMAYLMSHYEAGLPEALNKILSVTFGNPKVGDKDFCQYVNTKTKPISKYKAYRLHNDKDPVPRTPPQMMGFHHCYARAVISLDGRIYFPPEELKKDKDVTTQAVRDFIAVGTEILAFHDIFNYADATYQFRTQCEKQGFEFGC